MPAAARELSYRLTPGPGAKPLPLSLLLCQAGPGLAVETTVAHLDDDGMVWRILNVHGSAGEVDAARRAFAAYRPKHVVEREVMASSPRRLVLWYKYRPAVEGGLSHTALALRTLGRDTVVTDRTRGGSLTIRILARQGDALRAFLRTVRRQPGFELMYLGPPRDEVDARLTPPEEETVRAAWQAGYFRVPGAVDVRDVAGRLGVSPSAASYRIRRAVAKLVARHVEA